MKQATLQRRWPPPEQNRRAQAWRCLRPLRLTVWTLAVIALAGCHSGAESFWRPESLSWTNLTRPNVDLPPPPQETIYRAGHWEEVEAPQPGTLAGDLASAKVLFDRGEYEDAEKVFRWLAKAAEKEKNARIVEEALFMRAECLYHLREYPEARDVYYELLDKFPSSIHRPEAIERQFAIADYWLDETREEMKRRKEDDGWFSFDGLKLVHWEKEKPIFDVESHAQKACEAVYLQDPSGPLAPHALYRAGGISFFRERYDEADNYYSTLVEQYPQCPLAPPALELALQAKIQLARGPDYDSRKLVEAREMIDTALRSYPELRKKHDALERTMITINERQAEKDFNIAEFYRRTHHPGAAYFYYELVRRRYPGTHWADKATQRMLELRAKVEEASKE